MKKAFTLVELMVVLAICAILTAMLVGGLGGCSASDGSRVGTISKFSYKGMVVRSYEGEMILGGVRSGAEGAANIWQFTVTDGEVARQIEKIQETGHRVKAFYNQSVIFNPFMRDTAYTVYKVIDIEATPER